MVEVVVDDVDVSVDVCAAVTDVLSDVATVEPFLLAASTMILNVVPTSARPGTYVLAVLPRSSEQEAPLRSQRAHWNE